MMIAALEEFILSDDGPILHPVLSQLRPVYAAGQSGGETGSGLIPRSAGFDAPIDTTGTAA